MNPLYVMGLLAVGAYLLQIIFGMQQIKHFNQTYQALRQQGKVAIGRRAGKVQAGTIIMFALSNEGVIIEGAKMQGVTVLAKFKGIPAFKGIKIMDLSPNHPLVAKENKLTQKTILNAQEIYRRVNQGEIIEEPAAPILNIGLKLSILKTTIYNKFRRSV
ncbi:transcriptional regulator GutM [Enterococcus rivorum]|uniref:Transcriptional regulator n=1 Tax=Enterococcus rivorum TaxID=762845 RepID=A0A1E5L143_9ENTE|nr:transcriptional regulator GutM [Enterococcus rivorum]MBP2098595.1 DNA-binding transcriptional regulator of glucitol operon [Enterococcus rivorum]OEH83872.1 transcriptional regulator [Enterococcus rivorum]